MNTKRLSNMELLRIITMLMIIIYHIFCHTILGQLTDQASIEVLGNGFFCYPYVYKKILFLSTLSPLGKVGDSVFILISGYFTFSKKSDINLIKVSKKLLTQQLFAAIMLTVFSAIIWKLVDDVYISLFDFSGVNSMSWFIGYYFLLIVFAKFFLNNFLDKLDRTQFIGFLLTVFAISQFSWTSNLLGYLTNGLNDFCVGIFLYSLGAGIRKFSFFEKLNTSLVISVIVGSFILVCLSAYNYINLQIENYTVTAPDYPFIQSVPLYSENSFVCIVIGIALFEIFRRIEIGFSRFINYLGAATLMVYLLHDNSLVYSLWNIEDWITLLYFKPLLFIGVLLLYAVLTFAAGVVLYSAYLLADKAVTKLLKAQLRGAE